MILSRRKAKLSTTWQHVACVAAALCVQKNASAGGLGRESLQHASPGCSQNEGDVGRRVMSCLKFAGWNLHNILWLACLQTTFEILVITLGFPHDMRTSICPFSEINIQTFSILSNGTTVRSMSEWNQLMQLRPLGSSRCSLSTTMTSWFEYTVPFWRIWTQQWKFMMCMTKRLYK